MKCATIPRYSTYVERRAKADTYTPALKLITQMKCSQSILRVVVSTEDEDRHQATDLTFECVGGKVSCRVRFPESFNRKVFQMRYQLVYDGSFETEFKKIVEYGYSDFYLYAWAHPTEPATIGRWMFLDLHKMRANRAMIFDRMTLKSLPGQNPYRELSIGILAKEGAILQISEEGWQEPGSLF